MAVYKRFTREKSTEKPKEFLKQTELQALWEAGVDGVVVEVGVEQPAGRLMELRQAIDSSTLPPQRKREKPAALVPYTEPMVGAVTEEPEEE